MFPEDARSDGISPPLSPNRPFSMQSSVDKPTDDSRALRVQHSYDWSQRGGQTDKLLLHKSSRVFHVQLWPLAFSHNWIKSTRHTLKQWLYSISFWVWYFLNESWCWVYFCILTGHWLILFKKTALQSFSILMRTFVLLLLNARMLYKLWIKAP